MTNSTDSKQVTSPTKEKEPEASVQNAPAASPTKSSVQADREKAANSLITAGLGGMVGLVVGVIIGMNVSSDRQSARPKQCPPATTTRVKRTAVPAVLLPKSPAGVRLDLGTKASQGALKGSWQPQGRMEHRTVAVAQGSGASIVITKAPPAGTLTLAVVAKTVGLAASSRLAVDVKVNDDKSATWQVGSDWQLLSAKLAANTGKKSPTTIEFSWPQVASGQGQERKPTLAVDFVQLTTLEATAALSLKRVQDRAQLLSGFYRVESNNATVWSRGLRSTMGIMLAPVAKSYELKIRAYSFTAVAPLLVQAEVNGKIIGSTPVSVKLGEVVFKLPKGALVYGANQVSLIYPKTGRPADNNPQSRDNRDLAIRFFGMTLKPTGS